MLERIELQGPGLTISAVGFGCGGLMQSPFRRERMAVLGIFFGVQQPVVDRRRRHPAMIPVVAQRLDDPAGQRAHVGAAPSVGDDTFSMLNIYVMKFTNRGGPGAKL